MSVMPSPGIMGGNPGKNEEIFNGTVAVRPKSLVAGNSVYQISNISEVSVLDLTTIKQIPVYFWFLLAFGLLLFFVPYNPVKIFGFLILCAAAYVIYRHMKNRVDAKYAMLVVMNSATRFSLVSSDLNALKFLTLQIYRAIDKEDVLPFNVINNNGTLSMVYANGSVVNHGIITGDVANQV